MITFRRNQKLISNKICLVDRATYKDIYHVSEYCADIEQNMQNRQSETLPDPIYMRR